MAEAAAPLRVGGGGRSSLGWWGMICVVATEGSLFVYLLFSYFYVNVQRGADWPAGRPSLTYALPAVVALVVSSAAVWWAERGARRGMRRDLLLGLALAILLGVIFVVLQALDWGRGETTSQASTYGSLFYTITGFHLAHLVAGLLLLLPILFWSALGYFDARRHEPVLIGALYWYFVVVVGVAVFLVLDISPYVW
ncbi:MAG: cytochrome c oxidase subunit 3 [Pseudomonadota bacterium]|nr:cytochrome c oxidase subunit 3 [Pseudomonadota bacterium]